MSRSAEYFLAKQDRLEMAQKIAERTGVLIRCPRHSTVLHGAQSIDTALNVGLQLFNEKQLITEFETREDVINAFHDAVNGASQVCPACAGAQRDCSSTNPIPTES